MIQGNVDEFIEELYYGQEMNFSYNDKQYFIQGWTEQELFTLELCQTIPLTTNEGYCVWKDTSDNSQNCVNNFLQAKIFNGKTFWEVEQEIEWLYDWPIDDEEETKMYYMKHPEDINLPNALKIDLTPKKISEMDENFQNFAKRMITKTDFGTIFNSEFYNKSGKIMTGIEYLTWYFEEGFKHNEYSWKASNYDYYEQNKNYKVKKISEVNEVLQKIVKNSGYGFFKNNEFYNPQGEILTIGEFIEWKTKS